jgi:uncharacterized protein YceH (UPF0502 family)
MTSGVVDPRAEMQSILHTVAGREGSVKIRINNAARRVGLSFNRAKDLWYGDQRAAIKAEELEKARAVARKSIGVELDDIAALKARIESLESTVRALLAR